MDPIRVLVVDDEEELVSALVERMEMRDIHAVGVTEGRAAIERVDAEPFDVALVDLKMPGMDGLQVIRSLLRRRPRLKCVLLTGHGAAENEARGRACGAVACLMKPVALEDLLALLERLCPGKGSPDA